jgi:hypothetical protein
MQKTQSTTHRKALLTFKIEVALSGKISCETLFKCALPWSKMLFDTTGEIKVLCGKT